MINMAELSKLAELQWAAQQKVLKAEEALKQAKRELAHIAEELIPDAMDTAGVMEVLTGAGLRIKVQENTRASLTLEKYEAGIRWLREHGFEKIITNTITVQPEKGNDGEVTDFLNDNAISFNAAPKVHPGTLAKFVKERMQAGDVDIPTDLFSVYDQRVAKVTID